MKKTGLLITLACLIAGGAMGQTRNIKGIRLVPGDIPVVSAHTGRLISSGVDLAELTNVVATADAYIAADLVVSNALETAITDATPAAAVGGQTIGIVVTGGDARIPAGVYPTAETQYNGENVYVGATKTFWWATDRWYVSDTLGSKVGDWARHTDIDLTQAGFAIGNGETEQGPYGPPVTVAEDLSTAVTGLVTIIDDDTMATATDSNVASAESVKAYVDTATAPGDVELNAEDTLSVVGGVLKFTDNGVVYTVTVVAD